MRIRLALLVLLVGCAHATPDRDSPPFRACRAACAIAGTTIQAVVEQEEGISCVCRKPAPLPQAPGGA